MNDFDNKQICSYKDIDRFGFTCDVCGRKVNGCHYINGMKFCAKCYQETFGKDNQQNEIQQLKQQLDHQKAMWNELKEWIEKDHDWNLERGNNDCALGQRWVLDKMQELEKGEKE